MYNPIHNNRRTSELPLPAFIMPVDQQVMTSISDTVADKLAMANARFQALLGEYEIAEMLENIFNPSCQCEDHIFVLGEHTSDNNDYSAILYISKNCRSGQTHLGVTIGRSVNSFMLDQRDINVVASDESIAWLNQKLDKLSNPETAELYLKHKLEEGSTWILE